MKLAGVSVPVVASLLALSLGAPARGQDPGQKRMSCPGRCPYGWYGQRTGDPYEEFRELRRMMDRLFADAYRMDYGGPAVPLAEPSIDLRETEGEIIVTCDLPGMDKEKIEISLQENILTISGQRERLEEVADGTSGYYRSERVFGSFRRSVILPAAVDEKDVKAEYKDGVLAVVLKKLEAEEPEGVKIKVL